MNKNGEIYIMTNNVNTLGKLLTEQLPELKLILVAH